MGNIAVLTYNQRHKKTYDTLCLLKAKGYHKIKVYAQPMTYIKKRHPLVNHRPEQIMSIPEPNKLCENFGYEYIEGNFNDTIVNDDMLYLLCGAGLLTDAFVKRYRIINSHPGYIPYARGLDSYKWSIYHKLPLGVTTHFLGEYIDGGEIIEQRRIEVKRYDTFHSVAQRIYEKEIDMLVNAVGLAEKKHTFIMPVSSDVFKRMPLEIEEKLFEIFEEYKTEYAEG